MYFKEVIGQDSLKEKIIQNINLGRVSHAQLLLGPEGCGNLVLAIAYARYLSCKNRQPSDACGTCTSCIKFNKLSHPDLNFFYPVPARTEGGKSISSKDFGIQWRSFLTTSRYVGLNDWYRHINIENKQGIIGAEDCNEIIKLLSYKSFESEYKIIIIWMIERLFHSTAPKLLKTLEEPSDKTLLLLVSENQDQILNTILSRTQLLKVSPLSDHQITESLINNYKCDAQRARQIAFMSEGNFVKALSVMANPEIFQDSMNIMRDWLRACFSFNIPVLIGFVDQLATMGREKQKELLTYGIELMRQCIMANYGISDLLKADDEAKEFILKLKNVVTPHPAKLISEQFSSAIVAVERNANPKILFTDLSFKTAQLLRLKK